MALMDIDVVLLPAHLAELSAPHGIVVVFDVLRATTSITAALAAGIREIRIFPTTAAARAAREADPQALLCGEENCLPPAGFDLGNSPGAFTRQQCANRRMLMCTTNGTRAILAASGARVVLAGALVNADAIAQAVVALGMPRLTLLCAGTGGRVAAEDVAGAGAVADAVRRLIPTACFSDAALIAHRLFLAARDDLRGLLAASAGGRNVLAAGLAADIDFAARLNVLPVVGEVSMADPGGPVVRRRPM